MRPLPLGAVQPPQPYLGVTLNPKDNKAYSAAGLLAYRVSACSLDVLLGRHPSRQGTWSWIGGKREPGEVCSVATAAREVHEESLGHLTANWVEAQLRSQPQVLWHPNGRYAVHLAEVENHDAGGDVAAALTQLPSGRMLQLRLPSSVSPTNNSTILPALATVGTARTILTERGGGPMLLSQLMALMYKRKPCSRWEVRAAGGAVSWCASAGIMTAGGLKRTARAETAWLSQALTTARAILNEHDGGPILLSRLMALMYEREPSSKLEVRTAGGAANWCACGGIMTEAGPKGPVGMETAWLGQPNTLEVDHLVWFPWILLATRADYSQPISLSPHLTLRMHPYLQSLLRSPAHGLLQDHFDRVVAGRR